jgi:hypothetical protein
MIDALSVFIAAETLALFIYANVVLYLFSK